MRKLIFLVLLALAVPAVAQDFTEPVKNGRDIYQPYPSDVGDVKEIFGSRENWEINHSAFFADVRAGGYVDTSYGDTAIYYGHVLYTGQIDGFPTIYFTGMDSVIIRMAHRWVSRTGDVFAYGPWTELSDSVKLTTPRNYTPGKGGGRDTLVQSSGTIAAACCFQDSTFYKTKAPYMQYRYTVISQRSNQAAPNAKKDFQQPENKRFNFHWLGEAVLTFTRRYL